MNSFLIYINPHGKRTPARAILIHLRNGKAIRKHILYGKIAAMVLLKLFIPHG